MRASRFQPDRRSLPCARGHDLRSTRRCLLCPCADLNSKGSRCGASLNMLSLMLLVVIVVVAGWAWTLRTKLRRQTGMLAAMAYLEHRRSRVFADINSPKPLAEILETITDLTSSMLNGAPCWCEIADGVRLGHYPEDADRLHILHEEIPARSGRPLGTLFAGLDSKGLPGMHRTFVRKWRSFQEGRSWPCWPWKPAGATPN